MVTMILLPSEPYSHPHSQPYVEHRVIFKHRNCPKNGPTCEMTRMWTPSDIKQEPYPPSRYRTTENPEPKNYYERTSCCALNDWEGPAHEFIKREPDLNIPPEVIPTGVLANAYDLLLPFRGCYGDDVEDVTIDTISAAVVWEGDHPLNGRARPHTCSLTPLHLEMMRQRNCGDYIVVEFTATAHKKKGKLSRMLPARQAAEPKLSIVAPKSDLNGAPKLPLINENILSRLRRTLERKLT
ncbi:hypothetical protein GGR51DRAFT_567574 [Nemania sp. FL0031]|nr:hypothetical protein GGR51DRAFT_567574 [Nemania sp. FL0031]